MIDFGLKMRKIIAEEQKETNQKKNFIFEKHNKGAINELKCIRY